MAITYLQIVNDVLSEMNEVLLTQSNFDDAVNIQRTVKEMVNRAYMDINNPNFKWPWLAVNSPQNNFYGNSYVETVEGQRWYLFNPSSTNVNTDYGHVDWDYISLTEEGVEGKTSPYIVRNLLYLTIEEWKDRYSISEEKNKNNPAYFDTPKRVIRSPDNRYFGLSPIPDSVYRIYFFAWNRPSLLVYWDDEINLPDQYYGVLVARTRYYAWQRKENPNQAALAQEEYKVLLEGMRQQEIAPSPNYFSDSRVRWI